MSTTGISNSSQFVRFGSYHRQETFTDRPAYKHETRDEYLFYMPGRTRGLWMIGPEIGKFSGGLANRDDEVCPENINKNWKFADGKGWVVDSEVNVKCVDTASGTIKEALYFKFEIRKKLDPYILSIDVTIFNDFADCFYADEKFLEGGSDKDVKIEIVGSTVNCIDRCIEMKKECSYWSVSKKQDDNNQLTCHLRRWKGRLIERKGFISGSLPSACCE